MVSSCCSFWLLVSDFRPSAAIMSRAQVKPGTTGSIQVVERFLVSTNHISNLCALRPSGFTRVSVEMRALRQEVQTLRQRIDTVAPLADTIPNFALESLGESSSSSCCLIIIRTTVERVGGLISNFVCVFLICAGAKALDRLSSDTYQPSENDAILYRIYYFLYSSNMRRIVIQVQFTATLLFYRL